MIVLHTVRVAGGGFLGKRDFQHGGAVELELQRLRAFEVRGVEKLLAFFLADAESMNAAELRRDVFHQRA